MTHTVQELVSLSEALTTAVVQGRFMSSEHAKAVFIKFLRDSGLDTPRVDVPREVKPIKTETVEAK